MNFKKQTSTERKKLTVNHGEWQSLDDRLTKSLIKEMQFDFAFFLFNSLNVKLKQKSDGKISDEEFFNHVQKTTNIWSLRIDEKGYGMTVAQLLDMDGFH